MRRCEERSEEQRCKCKKLGGVVGAYCYDVDYWIPTPIRYEMCGTAELDGGLTGKTARQRHSPRAWPPPSPSHRPFVPSSPFRSPKEYPETGK